MNLEGQDAAGSVRHFFDHIPFNRLVGMELGYVGSDRVDVGLPMRPDLIGNFFQGTLHGGVISSILDVAGGCMAVVGTFERTKGMPFDQRFAMLSKIGTIDIRVDYLRPGKGNRFQASARLLRIGKKVAVTRMEMHDEHENLLALGTGTYICG